LVVPADGQLWRTASETSPQRFLRLDDVNGLLVQVVKMAKPRTGRCPKWTLSVFQHFARLLQLQLLCSTKSTLIRSTTEPIT
jgi:hypothetical protein